MAFFLNLDNYHNLCKQLVIIKPIIKQACTLARLILVVILSALRLTVATGTINGVILCQYIRFINGQYYHGQYLTFFCICDLITQPQRSASTTARVGFFF